MPIRAAPGHTNDLLAGQRDGIPSRILSTAAFLSSEAALALALTKAFPREGFMSIGFPTQSTTQEPQLAGPATRLELKANAEFEARWAAWVARGRRHDLALQRNVRIALSSSAGIALLAAILFAITAGVR